MIEVHLIGYTEDGEQLVLDLDPDGEGRYVLPIDPDLLATVAALREVRVATGRSVDARPAAAPRADERPPAPTATAPVAADLGHSAPDHPDPGPRDPGPHHAGRSPATGLTPADVDADVDVHADPGAGTDADAAVEADAGEAPRDASPVRSALSPAEIQRQLRAGRSVVAVAGEAGVDAAWIERWLPPILAERERVLGEAWARGVGPGSTPLREHVEAALAARGAPAERTSWTAARRADGRWKVSVRFLERGRTRSATWTMRDSGPLSPASPLATELSPRQRRGRRP